MPSCFGLPPKREKNVFPFFLLSACMFDFIVCVWPLFGESDKDFPISVFLLF